MLDGVVTLDVQRERLSAEEPGNILRARRSGEGAGVLVDTVRIQVSSQGSEIEMVSLGVGARSGNVVNVGEDGVEEGGRITELGQFKDKTNNSNGFVYSIISIIGALRDRLIPAYRQVWINPVESDRSGNLPEFSKTK